MFVLKMENGGTLILKDVPKHLRWLVEKAYPGAEVSWVERQPTEKYLAK